MSITLEQLSARMRQGEQVPLRHTAQVALTLSIPSILQQIIVTAMEYIDAAMVGHIGAAATASIGIVSSSTWLLHGMLAGLCMAFSIQVAQYLGADRQQDARGVLRQSMLFNLVVGLAAAAFGVGISRFLPGWLGADTALQANASAYFAIWSASLPFIMAMGTYAAMLRSTGDALTPGLISVFTCVLDIIFNFFLINPTREMTVLGQNLTGGGRGWGVPGAALHGLDATTGQNPIIQAGAFGESTGLTGVIITKLDGTAKGGMAVAIKNELGLPVRFIGVGEGIDDLRPFDADAFAEALI